VLTTAAIFISTTPPLVKDVNYTSNASYACLAESLIFSLFGLLSQLKASGAGILYRKRDATEVRHHIVDVRMARIDLTVDNNSEAVENLLASAGFSDSNHSLRHISRAAAHR